MPLEELKKIGAKYEGRVPKLLQIGRRGLLQCPKISYIEEFDLSREDISQLLALAQDRDLYCYDYSDLSEEESPEFYGVVHAWHALSELEAPEFKDPLIRMAEELNEDNDDDWLLDSFSDLIKPYRRDLYDYFVETILDKDVYEWTRVKFVNVIKEMLSENEIPLSKADEWVPEVLEHEESEAVNGFVISLCADLKLTKHYESIKKCFERGAVDIFIRGDLEDIEMELGLREERETPPPRLFPDFEDFDFLNSFAPPLSITRPYTREEKKIGRNDPCPCGSGKKYKKCCMNKG